MYKDIITYELAEGISQNLLLETAKEVLELWMNKQAGFLNWEIHLDGQDQYVDIVYWESKAAAKAAEKEMNNIPNGAAWFSCYKEGSIKSKNLSLIKNFNP